MKKQKKGLSGKIAGRILLDAIAFMLFTYILLSVVVIFANWYIGFIIITVLLTVLFCFMAMVVAVRDIHRILSQRPTLEQRIKVLEGAVIGDESG